MHCDHLLRLNNSGDQGFGIGSASDRGLWELSNLAEPALGELQKVGGDTMYPRKPNLPTQGRSDCMSST